MTNTKCTTCGHDKGKHTRFGTGFCISGSCTCPRFTPATSPTEPPMSEDMRKTALEIDAIEMEIAGDHEMAAFTRSLKKRKPNTNETPDSVDINTPDVNEKPKASLDDIDPEVRLIITPGLLGQDTRQMQIRVRDLIYRREQSAYNKGRADISATPCEFCGKAMALHELAHPGGIVEKPKASDEHDPIPPKGCNCASFWTIRGKHKADCPVELEAVITMKLGVPRIAHTPLGDTELLNAASIARWLMPTFAAYAAHLSRQRAIDELEVLEKGAVNTYLARLNPDMSEEPANGTIHRAVTCKDIAAAITRLKSEGDEK